jgi:phage N-6-adenine-methyltransferase
MARTMPAQKPGRSETVVQTPTEFIVAVKRYLGITQFGYDLAASADNAQALYYYDEEANSLSKDWGRLDYDMWNWLNPPYDRIQPWVEKASANTARIAVLIPASTGANWWRDYVDGFANILLLNGRLTFVGHTSPYPKDLALLLYGSDEIGYSVWNWRTA